ncbi:PREDICTED: zinc finger protein 425-like [Nicrophorus vespilloides]|uniref:Zinc finger protein 425-like n=1 Tax=Nicrophorus vespilloides TaxID=110193 RepID=A0ABM1N9I3_NICVS|nr:PREDICTED: zinc finger protein 425-like [Nicrophorus vespilloides]
MKCMKTYKYKSNMKRHLRYECGLSPKFKCHFCGQLFYYNCQLTKHVKKYHGLFECPKCRKTYMWKSTLRRHLQYECGQKPKFGCPICDRRFHQKVTLQKHLLKVHL